ncbi:hypothetical protein FZO89_00255 [Luteimonas viscosa]|uniref:Uncharacterized protein n=1 Tax=Luteimonas viscosa TaxID=1132694 RepID=A0A5D4XJL2_9GAMM|nr:hypothetical protein [Luteimonas viscosa]TYT24836.1 hypothetical protein FZO89_00255 [Luteimonas viscosa]
MELSLLSLLETPPVLRAETLERERAARGWSVERLCNELSVLVAKGFMAGELTFDAADTAMNWLWPYSFQAGSSYLPEPCNEIYLAFDAGEWQRRDDPPELDPVEAYTRPRLESILAQGYSASA